MQKSKIILGVIFFILLITGISLAQDFSADIIQTGPQGSFSGKIFVTKQKMRMEHPQAITITRMDQKVVWMLMPQQQMYMEQPFSAMNMPASTEKMAGEIERKLLGTETIDGKLADKYRIVYNNNGQQFVTLQWILKGLNLPVKSAAEDGSWSMEYKNIKIGAQPDSLFELPAGYKKFSYGGMNIPSP